MINRRRALSQAARLWWQEMSFEVGSDSARRAGGRKRAALAMLRRAAGPVEALAVPEAIDLYRRLMAVDHRVNPDRVAALAVALANLKPERENLGDDRRLPQAVGRKSFDDEKAILSEGRFRRLLQTDGPELLDAFRRLVRLVGGRASPESLADAILHWDDATRQRWIFDYYGISSGAPARTTIPADTDGDDAPPTPAQS